MGIKEKLKNFVKDVRTGDQRARTQMKGMYSKMKNNYIENSKPVKSHYPTAEESMEAQTRSKTMEMLEKKRNKNGRFPTE